jgi:hypothetical protein
LFIPICGRLGNATEGTGLGNAAAKANSKQEEIQPVTDPLERFLDFIFEREEIRLRRSKGEPGPWTDDPILREWSFTNIRREHDRVTKWIADNWRNPHANDPDLWFAMVVARLVNWPETLAEIGYPVPWDPDHFLAVNADRKRRGAKWESAAYMIHADSRRIGRIDNKARYQVECVFAPLWRDRQKLRPRPGETLAEWHRLLGAYSGIGDGFYSAQIVADMKQVVPLKSAKDWWTFAASGPGSKRGLNRILDRPPESPWREAEWLYELKTLNDAVAPELRKMGIGKLCAQDLQNCLCEFDKYERVRLGEGKPKRRYHPTDIPETKQGTLF